MKILVTGGAGFIGSHIVEHYQGKAAEIRVLDNLRTGYRHNLDGLDCTFIEASVTDRAAVREALHEVDLVFHLAALVSVPESMEKPAECVEINVTGLLILLEEAAAAGVQKVVFASSAAIYGDNPEEPKRELMLPEPKSPYAITKLDGEYYLEMFRRERNLETASIRFFNVFGPRQDPKGAYAAAVPITPGHAETMPSHRPCSDEDHQVAEESTTTHAEFHHIDMGLDGQNYHSISHRPVQEFGRNPKAISPPCASASAQFCYFYPLIRSWD
jgi:nucleoside-diphosphate-sugar epimerase